MHSGFLKLREGMSFNLCSLSRPPEPPVEALAEAREMLGPWEEALARQHSPGPYLVGPFSAADVMLAPAVVRLSSFRVPTSPAPRGAESMSAVLEHPAVQSWMDAARALPPCETYS